MKIALIGLVGLLLSCSTSQPESEHGKYIKIKSLIGKDRYSLAWLEIAELERIYPASSYLCELWNFQLALSKERDHSKNFIKNLEEKRAKNCEVRKP